MPEFTARVTPEHVRPLADRYLADLNRKPDHRHSEDRAIEVGRSARTNRVLTKSQLLELASWKSPRIVHHIEKNAPSEVEEVTRVALSSDSDIVPIPVLMTLRGVGWPMASVILHLCGSEPYPIVDIRAFESMGWNEVPNYSLAEWRSYTGAFRALLRLADVDARTLDRALWQFSYESRPKAG